MKNRYTLYSIAIIVLVAASGLAYFNDASSKKINGVCFVAPPRPIQESSLLPITKINADWVAITPYGFSRKNSPKVVYDHPNQWWGERVQGTIKTIEYARTMNLKVMLKPHIWVMGQGWAGEFELSNDDDWKIWEASYSDYILRFAHIADSMNVELLCIGTEYKMVVQQRPEFWKTLISKVRNKYQGPLTYAANWDNYMNVSFWNELDYIGIDAYFPICNSVTPEVNELRENWSETVKDLEEFASSNDKSILFTEYGYRSMNHCAGGHWDLDHQDVTPNLDAQKNSLEAFYATFWNKSWVAGGFIWKWFANHQMAGGSLDSHYTPQNKPAQEVVRKWYQN